MLCLDATHHGVAVPRRFAMDRGLRLVLSSRMPQPIEIGLTTIESELRFGGIPHYCIIPYDALWGAFNPDSGHGMFWPASMPPDIREGFDAHGMDARLPPGLRIQSANGNARKVAPAPPVRASGKPRLQVIEGGSEEGQEGQVAESSQKPATPPPRKPHLRLVE